MHIACVRCALFRADLAGAVIVCLGLRAGWTPEPVVQRQLTGEKLNSQKKNPAFEGPGSEFRTARYGGYIAVVFVHDMRLGVTTVCVVGVETTVVEGNHGGAKPCEKRWSK
jgi:hypothetical protein